jgi:hypothetical protein
MPAHLAERKTWNDSSCPSAKRTRLFETMHSAPSSLPVTTPFGPIAFLDTTQLPGTISLVAFGHAVEMVPRTLFVDFHEVPWSSGTNLVLKAEAKPSAERLKARNQQWQGR